MGDSWCMSWGWKTNDDRNDLHQKAETAIKYARWVSVAGSDIGFNTIRFKIFTIEHKILYITPTVANV